MQITNNIQNLQYGIKSDPATAKSAGTTDSLRDSAVSSKAESFGNAASVSGADAVIDKALEQAGLPKTDKNIQAARQLLENQMAVSKDNLRQLIQQSNIFREANISTLLLMNKNNIPINHFTAAQMQGYIDNQQNLLAQMGDAVGDFTELLSGENAVEINNELMELLTGNTVSYENEGSSPAGPLSDFTDTATNAAQSVSETAINTVGDFSEAGLQDGADSNVTTNVTNPESEVSPNATSTPTVSGDTASPAGSPMQTNTSVANDQISFSPENSSGIANTSDTLQAFSTPLSSADLSSLSAAIKNISGKEPDFEDKDAKGILSEIKDAIFGKDNAAVRDLINSPTYKGLIKKAFGDKFTMSPNDIKDADSINNYYKSTFSALSKMMEMAQKSGETQLADKLSKPMDNIKFMDTINNVMPFVQLPLKLESGAAHGELFVFKNGRNKTSPEEVKSVLLHLDMDSLGPTDIHMKLDHKHLNLKFYCNDAPSLRVLSDKIEDLSEALALKGFDISTDFSVRESTKQPIEEALSGSNSTEPAFVYGFDTRA